MDVGLNEMIRVGRNEIEKSCYANNPMMLPSRSVSECLRWDLYQRDHHVAAERHRLIQIRLNVIYIHVERGVVLGSCERGDVSRNGLAASVDHRSRASALRIPAEQLAEELLRRRPSFSTMYSWPGGGIEFPPTSWPASTSNSFNGPPVAVRLAHRLAGDRHADRAPAAARCRANRW